MRVRLLLEVNLSPSLRSLDTEAVLGEALRQGANDLSSLARGSNWPVLTGISRDAWRVIALPEVAAPVVGFGVLNDARDPIYRRSYAAYVRRRGKDPPVWTEIAEEVEVTLAPEIQGEIARSLSSAME